MSARPRLVVVGNGMAAARTLEHLLAIAPRRYAITVFGEEPHAAYNRILLSPVLAGELAEEALALQAPAWHAERGVDLRLGVRVTSIDRARRTVLLADGGATPYDRLLIATGSSPVTLPIPGTRLAGVVTYRDLRDTRAMIEAARAHRRAVVIGGGLLGLEAANGLRARGMEVDVVHLMPTLMERQLDADAAAIVQRRLEKRGIRFHLGARTHAITGREGRATSVVLQTAGLTSVAADLVVMAVGIRPNVALAEASGLRVERGILVDDNLQTYDPRIYAVGECVQHRGASYGLVQPLYEMAKVCATHLAGACTHYYPGSVPSTHLKVTGIDVFSAGDFADRPGRESLVLRDPSRGVYRRLVLEDDRLVGGVLVGDSRGAGRYTELIRSRAPLGLLRRDLMFVP
jgi:nitrite reductase (NADH) large subunit